MSQTTLGKHQPGKYYEVHGKGGRGEGVKEHQWELHIIGELLSSYDTPAGWLSEFRIVDVIKSSNPAWEDRDNIVLGDKHIIRETTQKEYPELFI